MDILKQLSFRNLKLNKKRTISTIMGIILSVALICAVATMVTSFQATLVENAINETGYYHIKIYNLNSSQIKTLKNNRDIKSIYTVQEIGYGMLDGGKNEDKPFLKLSSMEKDVFENFRFKLIEGRFPENNNEIIISKHIISNGKVEYKIGDKISINLGTRETLDGYKLHSSNPYIKEGEKLVKVNNYEFTIVGIIERPDYSFESYSDPGYTVITTNANISNKDVYIALKNPKNHIESISELLGVKDYTELSENEDNLKYRAYKVNNELLRWEALAFSDSTIQMLYAICGVVIFIIIFTSVFCIKNSFEIATSEKIKMYGMLASVGATKKQIKKNVIFEAIILGSIGIPLGILSGIFAVIVLINIVNCLIGEYLLGHVDGIIVKISLIPILISIVLGFITIYLSAISASRKASKVSPIENLRDSEQIKIKKNSLKTPKIISKLFKQGGVLAYKNLKRSKKKYRTTVMSLTISIFIFITMNVFITNMFDLTGHYYQDYEYNLKLYSGIDDLSVAELNKIVTLKDIKEYMILYRSDKHEYIKIKDLSKINQDIGIELQEDYYYDEEKDENILNGKKISRLMPLALDDISFRKFSEKAGLNYEKVKSTGILCDNYLYTDKETQKSKEGRIYKYKENDIIQGEFDNKEVNIKIGAVTNVRPYGIEQSYYDGGYIILNKDQFPDYNFKIYFICIMSNNPDETEKEIENLNLDITLMNIDASAREERSMVLVIKIFLYGFITVITLIGVTNIFNTITSNMELRQKEFAMLKSIGMTNKEFNKMINLETIFYSSKALFLGIILGLLGTFALYKAFAVKIDSGVYIPIIPIIISIIAVFILVFIIMRYSLSKINKQNTIETIRKENI